MALESEDGRAGAEDEKSEEQTESRDKTHALKVARLALRRSGMR